MNNRKRQQRRATDMMIRSRSLEKCNLSIVFESLNHLPEALASTMKAIGEFVAALQVVPVAIRGEPVNVIRCEDCEFSEPDPIGRERVMFRNQWERFTQWDGYCHNGSRKDDKNE